MEIKVFSQEGCQETYHAVSMISRVTATAPSKNYANLFSTARLELSFLADRQETYRAMSMISRVNATAPSKNYANLFFTARLELSFLADHPLD